MRLAADSALRSPSVRASLVHTNTEEEVVRLVDGLAAALDA